MKVPTSLGGLPIHDSLPGVESAAAITESLSLGTPVPGLHELLLLMGC